MRSSAILPSFFLSAPPMLCSELIKTFEGRTIVPVQVDDVVKVLADNGVKDEVYFFEARLNDEALRGTLMLWEWPTDHSQRHLVQVADIYYATSLTLDWQRLVCCKELIHILDPSDHQAKTPAEVKKLIAKIILPPDLQDAMDGSPVWSDRLAVYQAVAILFPWATRELLLPALRQDKLTIEEIATMVDLPLRYARFVMSDLWAQQYNFIRSYPDTSE